MYNAFFGLDTDPFRVNPDPRFLYFSESHREALAALIYAVRERKGFIVLSGEVGTGKTTVVNALLAKLPKHVQTAYLFNTALSLEDFFAYVFEELGLERVEPWSKSAALARLNAHLIERLRHGQQTLLLVDEAQNLPAELLEEIRMLSNLETPQSKLMQIVLVGQPELMSKLRRPELRQLRQRVELFHVIRSLTPHETAEYVRERLLIAGSDGGQLFSSGALRAVFSHSRGIPRMINVLCDNALLSTFAANSTRVSAQTVREAARDLGMVESVEMNGVEHRRDGWLRRIWPFRRTVAQAGI